MKANFKISNTDKEKQSVDNSQNKETSRSEFEDFIIKSGAKGSFMVYRSTTQDDELGLEQL